MLFSFHSYLEELSWQTLLCPLLLRGPTLKEWKYNFSYSSSSHTYDPAPPPPPQKNSVNGENKESAGSRRHYGLQNTAARLNSLQPPKKSCPKLFQPWSTDHHNSHHLSCYVNISHERLLWKIKTIFSPIFARSFWNNWTGFVATGWSCWVLDPTGNWKLKAVSLIPKQPPALLHICNGLFTYYGCQFWANLNGFPWICISLSGFPDLLLFSPWVQNGLPQTELKYWNNSIAQ